jgi:hypothetical protein
MGVLGLLLTRPVGERQGLLPFFERARRRERAFRGVVVAATVLAVVAAVGGSPAGRRGVASAAYRVRWWGQRQLGLEVPWEEIEAARLGYRLRGIERTRERLRRLIAEERDDRLARFLDAARMGPDSAVIRWGNYDRTLVLSSAVFEPDDAGRSYRLRPNARSTWMIGISLNGVACMFEVPDDPEVLRVGAAVGGRHVVGSTQTTNSWGCRGPEPDPDAPFRVLVLGDSVMQGVLVGDDETAPAQLERELSRRRGVRTSILNAGVLGYSAEQYYHTLLAFAGRFRPHVVVVSICGNDFGAWDEPAHWAEGKHWLDLIGDYCRARQLPLLFVSWPGEDSILGTRDDSVYAGKVSHILKHGRYALPLPDRGLHRRGPPPPPGPPPRGPHGQLQPAVQPPPDGRQPHVPARLRPLGPRRRRPPLPPARLGGRARRAADGRQAGALSGAAVNSRYNRPSDTTRAPRAARSACGRRRGCA